MIGGYIVLGWFEDGIRPKTPAIMWQSKRDEVLYFAGKRVTVFPDRSAAKDAIRQTMRTRAKKMGENDLSFRIVGAYV